MALTVTSQFAVLPPSTLDTTIVARPDIRAVILPFTTDATDGLLLDQITFLSVALSGLTVAVNVNSSPSVSSTDILSSKIDSTGMFLALTVTAQVAVLPPSSVVAVMIAFPNLHAVTIPLLTVATDTLLDVQITVLFSASLGETVAVSTWLPPSSSSIDVALKITEVTAILVGSISIHAKKNDKNDNNVNNTFFILIVFYIVIDFKQIEP